MQVPGGQSAANSQAPLTQGASGLIPQLSESFLDRLVALSSQNSDALYRQRLTEQIISAGQANVALLKETTYYQDMLASARRTSSGAVDRKALAAVEKGFDAIYAAVVRAVEQGNAIYQELSKQNLNPRTNLYAMTSPFTITTERVVTLRRLALYGIWTLMLSLLLVPLTCFIHHYFRREILPQPVARAPHEQHSEGETRERTVEEKPIERAARA
jgi:hypothetical protein